MPKRRPPLTNEEGEVRELTREDFKGMRPLREVDPGFIEAMTEFRRRVGRPKAAAPKVHVGFRLAADVVASVKASGAGYNARVEQALRKAGFGAKALKAAKAGRGAKLVTSKVAAARAPIGPMRHIERDSPNADHLATTESQRAALERAGRT